MKVILQFETLSDLAAFARTLPKGYLIDTSHLTLTTILPLSQVALIKAASYNVNVDFSHQPDMKYLLN